MPEPMKMSTPIAVFSSFNIVLGVVSISIQIAALILAADYVVTNLGFDYIASGIWCGIMYIIAGSFGIAASIKRTRGMLLATVVTTSLSIVCAVTATTLAAINADDGYYYYCREYKDCNLWLNLEWSLMGISAVCIINNVVLTGLASVPTCCSGKNKDSTQQLNYNQHLPANTMSNQTVMINGQPMYLVHPSQLHHPMNYHGQPSYPLQLQPQMLTSATWGPNHQQPINHSALNMPTNPERTASNDS